MRIRISSFWGSRIGIYSAVKHVQIVHNACNVQYGRMKIVHSMYSKIWERPKQTPRPRAMSWQIKRFVGYCLRSYKSGVSQNEDIIMLLLIKLVFYRFSGWKHDRPWFSCFLGLVETSPTPPHKPLFLTLDPLFWLWIHQIIQTNATKSDSYFVEISSKFKKYACRKIPGIRLSKPWKS